MLTIRRVLPLLCLLTLPAQAGLDAFQDGPLIKGYGQHAPVETTFDHNWLFNFQVAFDVAESGGETVNRRFDSLARFINMHAAAGTPKEKVKLALVVHGKATLDLLNNDAYRKRFGRDNPNVELLAALNEQGARVVLCGQSAVYQDVSNDDLLPGVEVALSAMTAHAVLSQLGYSSNPF